MLCVGGGKRPGQHLGKWRKWITLRNGREGREGGNLHIIHAASDCFLPPLIYLCKWGSIHQSVFSSEREKKQHEEENEKDGLFRDGSWWSRGIFTGTDQLIPLLLSGSLRTLTSKLVLLLLLVKPYVTLFAQSNFEFNGAWMLYNKRAPDLYFEVVFVFLIGGLRVGGGRFRVLTLHLHRGRCVMSDITLLMNRRSAGAAHKSAASPFWGRVIRTSRTYFQSNSNSIKLKRAGATF